MVYIAQKKYGFTPDYAIPPGDTLFEVMESLDIKQTEMSTRTGLTVQSLSRILKGTQPITCETANKLELVTGVPAHFWNNREVQYQEQLAKAEELERFKVDLSWLKTIPTLELINREYLTPQQDKVKLLRETLKFFGVSSVEAWHKIWELPAVAARRSQCFESQPGPASAWIRMGELEAHKIGCKPYNKALFQQALKTIRSLTPKNSEVFLPEMVRLCAEAGVAVALIPGIKKVPWSGATKWLSPNKAMILLCLRGKGEDKFWFSFFHEAGHILHDSKKDLLINDGSQKDPREERANNFAADFLIPPKYNDKISSIRSRDEIVNMAKGLEISAGIVAGRYQRLTKNWSYFKGLIQNFEWQPNE